MAISIGTSFLFTIAAAHWASPQVANVTPTHAHFVAGGLSTDVGYFGQRLCVDANNGVDLYWSHEDGTCPQPPTTPNNTVAFLPPVRGLGLGTGDCEDLTIDPVNYIIQTPHNGVYPDNIVVDNGDVDDAYISGSTMAFPHAAGIGGGSYGSVGNGLQPASALAQAPAANRIIWYDDIDGAAGQLASWTGIFGNDRYDGQTTYFPALGTPYTTTRAERMGVTTTEMDFTDHDAETGIGIACFTYAVDNGPNGVGSNGLAYGFSSYGDFPGDADGCQEVPVAADGGCGGAGRPPALVFCGAGLDLNDPAHPVGTVSITLTPEGPAFGPSPIGNDGVYDTTAASTAAPFTGCPGNGTTGTLRGTGAGILSGQLYKGVKLHEMVGSLLKIGYSLCHDVASTGCTNIPIEDSQSTPPGIPCKPGGPPSPLPPDPANAASGCYGHVGSRLQDCVYAPGNATQWLNQRRNPGSLGPMGASAPDFFGQAAFWGTRIQKAQPCWPERLYWNPGTNTWTPASEPGSYNGGVWSGDDAPATADATESITAFLSTADLGVMRGFTMCDEGSLAWSDAFSIGGGPSCQQTSAPTLPQPEPGTWMAGWAAVFL